MATGSVAKPRDVNAKEKLRSWKREDWSRTKHVTTVPAGPRWKSVVGRTVFDLDTEELIEDIVIDNGICEDEYCYDILSSENGRGRNIKTILKYRQKDSPDICEVYSPPRIVPEGVKLGLKPGFSLDFTVLRPDGNPWNFSIKRHRDEAVQMVLELEPYMLIGSPPCTMFSILQNGNKHRHTPEAWKQMMAKAEIHLNFCLTLYELQRRGGADISCTSIRRQRLHGVYQRL